MLRTRQKFGKYVIERKLGEGGFAVVYQARDTIEGVRVALKIPYAHLMSPDALEDFRREVRLAAKLEHPHILPLKYADYVDGKFVIVTALGEGTLEERLQKRISVDKALDFARQMLEAVAFAHEHRIIHCDIKPDNILILPGNQLRLTDFGIARVALKTLKGSGAGTVGYIAPEQAMGQPSFRSDVFSLGIVFYRMFAGVLPEWPYRWPPPGHQRLRARVSPEFMALIRRAIDVDARQRYRDAGAMLTAFKRLKSPAKKASRAGEGTVRGPRSGRNWQEVRRAEFMRTYGKALEVRDVCSSCSGPVAEVMHACPWCGKARRKHSGEKTRFSVSCPRCQRGMKSDWTYCPWCYGPGFVPGSTRELPDRRYTARCDNPVCQRKVLMPFMKYCPWCRHRVKKKWKLAESGDKCGSCGWGVLASYWSFCPWCGKRMAE